MFSIIFFLTFIATTFVHFTIANISLENPDNTNLFLDDELLASDGPSLWDTDVGDGYTNSAFLADSNPLLALNNDQTDLFEQADIGDLCEAPPSKRARRDITSQVCTPSDRQGLDQSVLNQLKFPNILDIFKPKKKESDQDSSTPTTGDDDGNTCPPEHPLHLCCLKPETRWTEIQGPSTVFFALYVCTPGKIPSVLPIDG